MSNYNKNVEKILKNTENQELKTKINNRKKQKGLMVIVENNNVNLAIKRLKRKLKNNSIMQEYMDKRFYKSKSEIRRKKKSRKKLILKYDRINRQKEQQKYDNQ